MFFAIKQQSCLGFLLLKQHALVECRLNVNKNSLEWIRTHVIKEYSANGHATIVT